MLDISSGTQGAFFVGMGFAFFGLVDPPPPPASWVPGPFRPNPTLRGGQSIKGTIWGGLGDCPGSPWKVLSGWWDGVKGNFATTAGGGRAGKVRLAGPDASIPSALPSSAGGIPCAAGVGLPDWRGCVKEKFGCLGGDCQPDRDWNCSVGSSGDILNGEVYGRRGVLDARG